MKKYLLIALIVLGFNYVTAQTQEQASAQNTLKIGYVDLKTIYEVYSEAIKAKADLKAIENQWYAVIDSMTQDLQKSYGDYQAKAKTIKDEKKRQDIEKGLVEKEQAIRAYQQQKFGQQNGEIYKKNEEILLPVMNKVKDAIADVAKVEGMHYVLNGEDGVVLYSDLTYDITYKVLDRLKKGK